MRAWRQLRFNNERKQFAVTRCCLPPPGDAATSVAPPLSELKDEQTAAPPSLEQD